MGETERPEISRMTIVVSVEGLPLEQVTKQLNKLINVIKIVELEPESTVERELIMVKVRADLETRSHVLETVNFRAKVVDVAPDTVTIEATATVESSMRSLRCWSNLASRNLWVREWLLSGGAPARSVIAAFAARDNSWPKLSDAPRIPVQQSGRLIPQASTATAFCRYRHCVLVGGRLPGCLGDHELRTAHRQ